MLSTDNVKKNLKRPRTPDSSMPATDSINMVDSLDDELVFPVEEIVQNPLPGYVVPTSLSFSPDDTFMTYLFSPEQTLNKNVFSFDLKTRKQELFFSPPDGGLDENNISAEEKLRRERLRERGLGVTRYEWVKTNSKKKTIMVPLPNGIYFQDLSSPNPELKLPSSPSSPIIDPRLSPDGTMLAFVRDSELHVHNLLYNETNQLTSDAHVNGVTNGLAEYIAQEEMDRKNGYWWSLDSRFIAFAQVDSSEIPLFRIMHQGKSSVGLDAQEDHAYPFAGQTNVNVRLGVISFTGGPVTWMDISCGGKNQQTSDEEYLARVHWLHGNSLSVQVLNRRQTELKILKFDITTGERETLLVERNEKWVNLHDCFTPLGKGVSNFGGGFIWASEKTGYKHLYLHDSSGNCISPITEGEWMVEHISGVNEAAGLIYFTGTLDGPLESHLYCAKLFCDGDLPIEPPRRLTEGKGKHMVVLDHHNQSIKFRNPSMATSSTFATPLSAFNRTTAAAARFPTKITAAYTTTNRSSSSTSYYEILGIQTSATYNEIKQAYRKLARLSHPDVVSAAASSSSADEFIRIHSAYATLSDPAKRADYDRTIVVKTRGVRSFEMDTTTYGYARAADTTAISYRRWETDQCW